jgi:hypothetical protein
MSLMESEEGAEGGADVNFTAAGIAWYYNI